MAEGDTGLHKKARDGDSQAVIAEIRKGADLSAKNGEGMTAEDVATDPYTKSILKSAAAAQEAENKKTAADIEAAAKAAEENAAKSSGSFAEYVKSRPQQDFGRADFQNFKPTAV